MSIKFTKIHAAWDEYKSVIAKKETSLKGIKVDDLISSFFCPGPFYYYIFDFSKLCFVYIHPNITEIFGVDPDDFTIDDFIARVHPDDISHMANGEKMAFDFIIKHMPLEKRKKYKINYCMRMKTANGNYKLFLQQALALTLDKKGNLGKVVGVQTDISHITTVNNCRFSLIGIDGEPSYLNLDPKNIDGFVPSQHHLFSKREVEIIKFLAEGFICREISDKLFISIDTVRTHQKNILSKSGCNTTVQLVSKCIRDGLI